jgi:hypothetical protein
MRNDDVLKNQIISKNHCQWSTSRIEIILLKYESASKTIIITRKKIKNRHVLDLLLFATSTNAQLSKPYCLKTVEWIRRIRYY